MAQYTVPSPISINGFSVEWETAKVGLHEVILHSADAIRDFVPELYNKSDFKQKTMKKKVYSGLTQAAEWSTDNIISPEAMAFLYDVDATHYFYAKACQYNLEAKTFDEYDMLKRLPGEVGKALGEKKQRLGAAFFNDGFYTQWKDGRNFFAADHPFDRRVTGVLSQSNLVEGALCVSTLQDAINLLINARDPLGRPMNYLPKRLWVHPTRVMYARQILGVDMGVEYGTPDRNRNPFRDFTVEVMPFPWFTSTTMWMLQGTDTHTFYSMPVNVTTNVEQTDAHGIKLEGWFACAFWAEMWQGWVGSIGV